MQYVEEPVGLLENSLRFSRETGIPIALDETLDEVCAGGMPSGVDAALDSALPGVDARSGVTAVVLKPGVLGGFERSWRIAAWAAGRGMQVGFLLMMHRDCSS